MNFSLIVITGPSGSGKSTIVKKLLSDLPFLALSVSATTRKRRDAEVDGVHYSFVSTDEFKEKIERGEFLEHEEVYEGCFYGTPHSEIARIQGLGKIPLLEIDAFGAVKIEEKYKDDVCSFFIHPGLPLEDVLSERLRIRKTEEDFSERVRKAGLELELAGNFDFVVLNENDKLDQSLNFIQRVIEVSREIQKLKEKLKLLMRQSDQIKLAMSPENLYFTGLDVHHPPSPSEAALHFALNGGAKNFAEKNPSQ